MSEDTVCDDFYCLLGLHDIFVRNRPGMIILVCIPVPRSEWSCKHDLGYLVDVNSEKPTQMYTLGTPFPSISQGF